VKLQQAFQLGILPDLAGFRFDGQELIERVAGGASGALLEKVHEHTRRLRARDGETVSLVLLAERILTALGVAPPPRPRTPADYEAWAQKVADEGTRAAASDVHETATYHLGRALGDVLHTLALRVLTDDLLAAAPDQPLLLAQRDALQRGEEQALRRFALAASSPAHNDAARRVLDETQKVLDTLRTAAPRQAVFKHVNAALAPLEAALRE